MCTQVSFTTLNWSRSGTWPATALLLHARAALKDNIRGNG